MDIRQCQRCDSLEPNPVIRAHSNARLLIIGQAPGSKVHATGIPWNDPSGHRLRSWLELDNAVFYDESQVAIVPMAFCYPGKGRSGDLPPPPLCAEQWHSFVLAHLPKVELTLLIGNYSQKYYLPKTKPKTLTDTVRAYQSFVDEGLFPLPHPSPRNTLWLKKNSWFESEVLPDLRQKVRALKLKPSTHLV